MSSVISPQLLSQSEDAEGAILKELERISASELFRRSPGLLSLLRFLIAEERAGHGADLKEVYIGHTHFRRDATYDPKADALVRVNANRLRVRLAELYEQQPAPRVQIVIPRGSYTPTYVWVTSLPENVSQAAFSEGSDAPTPAGAVEDAPEVSSLTDRPFMQQGSLPRLWFAGVGLGALLLSLGVLAVLLWPRIAPPASEQFVSHPFTRLSGVQTFASFSPDGHRIAFSGSDPRDPERAQLYVQNLGSADAQQLTSGTGQSERPAWSPDGQQIAFLHTEEGRKDLRILDLPTHQVLAVTALHGSFPWLCQVSGLSWTRDGRTLISVDSTAPDQPCRITAIDIATGARQTISHPDGPVIADLEPAVSPNGRQIAFLRNTGTLVGDLYTMDVHGGNLRRVTHDGRDIMGFTWDHRGEGLVVASRREDGVLRLWHLSLTGGSPQRITEGLAEVGFPSESPDGLHIVLTSYFGVTRVWRVWADGRAPERLLADQSTNADAQSSPDGRFIAFRSNRSGPIEIWRSDRDGSNARQLTHFNGPTAGRPTWSPDGRQLALECRDQGHMDICLMSSDGGPLRHITDWSSNQQRPVWSRDGHTLFFLSNHTGHQEVFEIREGQREPEKVPGQLQEQDIAALALSWDGRDLLLAEAKASPGVFCGPPPNNSAQPQNQTRACTQGDLLYRLPASSLADAWDAAPGGLWYASPSPTSPSTTDIFLADRSSGAARKLLTFPHAVVQGDRSLTVDGDGKSALLVEQGEHGANLALLERVGTR